MYIPHIHIHIYIYKSYIYVIPHTFTHLYIHIHAHNPICTFKYTRLYTRKSTHIYIHAGLPNASIPPTYLITFTQISPRIYTYGHLNVPTCILYIFHISPNPPQIACICSHPSTHMHIPIYIHILLLKFSLLWKLRFQMRFIGQGPFLYLYCILGCGVLCLISVCLS